jgi:4-oxalocrotonate tautomerase
MDIKVTAGTNSDAEKAAMVEAGHTLLVDVLGVLPEATYVIIHDLPGGNWGYAGKTQAARAQAR